LSFLERQQIPYRHLDHYCALFEQARRDKDVHIPSEMFIKWLNELFPDGNAPLPLLQMFTDTPLDMIQEIITKAQALPEAIYQLQNAFRESSSVLTLEVYPNCDDLWVFDLKRPFKQASQSHALAELMKASMVHQLVHHFSQSHPLSIGITSEQPIPQPLRQHFIHTRFVNQQAHIYLIYPHQAIGDQLPAAYHFKPETPTWCIKRYVTRLIEQSLENQRIREDMVAKSLAISTRQLQRQLQEKGTSFRQLVSEIRIQQACYYLQHTRLTIEEMAFKLGYSAPAHFSRAFKTQLGITPLAYRQRSLNPTDTTR
jgi:AraC-like DNA-binding protein